MEVSVSAETIAAGSLSAVDAGGETLAIANIAGNYYAVSNVCTHRGCSISEGTVSGTEITCICHGACFDLRTGEVMGGPAREPLKTYAVSLSDGNVIVVV